MQLVFYDYLRDVYGLSFKLKRCWSWENARENHAVLIWIYLTAFDAIYVTLDIFYVASLDKPSSSLHVKRPLDPSVTKPTIPLEKQRRDIDSDRGTDSFLVEESFVNVTWMVDQRNLREQSSLYIWYILFSRKNNLKTLWSSLTWRPCPMH